MFVKVIMNNHECEALCNGALKAAKVIDDQNFTDTVKSEIKLAKAFTQEGKVFDNGGIYIGGKVVQKTKDYRDYSWNLKMNSAVFISAVGFVCELIIMFAPLWGMMKSMCRTIQSMCKGARAMHHEWARGYQRKFCRKNKKAEKPDVQPTETTVKDSGRIPVQYAAVFVEDSTDDFTKKYASIVFCKEDGVVRFAGRVTPQRFAAYSTSEIKPDMSRIMDHVEFLDSAGKIYWMDRDYTYFENVLKYSEIRDYIQYPDARELAKFQVSDLEYMGYRIVGDPFNRTLITSISGYRYLQMEDC